MEGYEAPFPRLSTAPVTMNSQQQYLAALGVQETSCVNSSQEAGEGLAALPLTSE